VTGPDAHSADPRSASNLGGRSRRRRGACRPGRSHRDRRRHPQSHRRGCRPPIDAMRAGGGHRRRPGDRVSHGRRRRRDPGRLHLPWPGRRRGGRRRGCNSRPDHGRRSGSRIGRRCRRGWRRSGCSLDRGVGLPGRLDRGRLRLGIARGRRWADRRRRRRRAGLWSRNRRGQRLGRLGRRRRRRIARGQEPDRIDVPLRIGGDPCAEVDVGLGVLGVSGLRRGADDRLLRDRRSARDGDRAEVLERHGVPVRGQDRDRSASRRNRPGEGHGAGSGSENLLAGRGRNVDAAVLTSRVRVASRKRERPQDRSAGGPAPGGGARGPGEGAKGECSDDNALHSSPLRFRRRQQLSSQGSCGMVGCQFWLQRPCLERSGRARRPSRLKRAAVEPVP
jgi:hypothetical protein